MDWHFQRFLESMTAHSNPYRASKPTKVAFRFYEPEALADARCRRFSASASGSLLSVVSRRPFAELTSAEATIGSYEYLFRFSSFLREVAFRFYEPEALADPRCRRFSASASGSLFSVVSRRPSAELTSAEATIGSDEYLFRFSSFLRETGLPSGSVRPRSSNPICV